MDLNILKQKKVDNYESIGYELDQLYENDKLFSFCFNNFINREIEMREFKIQDDLF